MTREQQEEAIQRMMFDPATAEVCPECGGRITQRWRVGRSLYLRPCGHRVGQIGEDGKMLSLQVSIAR